MKNKNNERQLWFSWQNGSVNVAHIDRQTIINIVTTVRGSFGMPARIMARIYQRRAWFALNISRFLVISNIYLSALAHKTTLHHRASRGIIMATLRKASATAHGGEKHQSNSARKAARYLRAKTHSL